MAPVQHVLIDREAALYGRLRKRSSENIQQIYRRKPILKCDFNKVALQIILRHGCSPVNLLCISRTPIPKNISGRLPLHLYTKV